MVSRVAERGVFDLLVSYAAIVLGTMHYNEFIAFTLSKSKFLGHS